PRISCTRRMSMPYSSLPRVKARNSFPATSPASVSVCVCVLCDMALSFFASEKNGVGVELAAGAQQCGNSENPGSAAVPQSGGAGNAGHLAEIRFKIFDDDLLLPDQAVDQQGCLFAVGLENDDDPLGRIGKTRLDV